MKIWCDVCDKDEATLFCSADEAALCEGCDLKIHRANKLASKHTRFSLLKPSFKESPLCDICQERRGFLFCQEDRAILCRECDLSIHRANEHTQKHIRFLLTGVKLSSSSSIPSTPATSDGGSESKSYRSSKRRSVSRNEISTSSEKRPLPSTIYRPPAVEDNCTSDSTALISATSSISEYLMETLPGWRVDDFLEPSFSTFEQLHLKQIGYLKFFLLNPLSFLFFIPHFHQKIW